MLHDRDSGSSALLSFLLGGLAGASLAVLFAPRSGEDLRDSIGDGVRGGADRGRALVGQGREATDRLVDKGRSVVRRKKAIASATSEPDVLSGGMPGGNGVTGA
jgi:gas vesicle protein